MLDLRQVLSFVTIAEKRSFTQAAETLEIAQSAVSQHIRRLEDQLQLTLLTRNSRSVALSADGQAMLPHAQALLDSEQNILAAARALRAATNSILRIGAYSFAADQRMDAIDAFQNRYPELRLEIVYGTRAELMAKLRDGTLDIFFSLSAPSVTEPDLAETHVARRYCHIAVPPTHRLAGSEGISIDDLADEQVAISPGNQDSPVVSLVYAGLIAHGAQLIAAPEADRRAIARFARSRGLPHLLWTTRILPRHEEEGEEIYPLLGDAPRIDTVIYSRPGDRRRWVRLILAAFADHDKPR